MISSCLPLLLILASRTNHAIASDGSHHPSSEATAKVANEIRALLTADDGSGSWGDRGDLMGLLVRLPFHDAATFTPDNAAAAATPTIDATNTVANATNMTDNDTSAPSSTAVGGSDGCVDLASLENKGLQEAIDLLEPIRLQHGSYTDPNGDETLLSRGDVWALAGNLMIESAGGPRLEYKVGRVDASDCAGQGERHVGSESTSSKQLEESFVNTLGLTHSEVVALIGAHVLGKATREISGYEGPWVETNDNFTNRYFVDMIHIPWNKQEDVVEPFGERTTWRRFESMRPREELMLQTDVDLAFQTTGGYYCSRIGGDFQQGLSCPNATHSFAEYVYEFAADEEAWRDEFAMAWAKLTSMTTEDLECVVLPDCLTPMAMVDEESSAMVVTGATIGWWSSLMISILMFYLY